MSKEVHIFGMRRTGTCFMVECLRDNYDCEVEDYHKHMTIDWPVDNMVVMVRNPLSWMPSRYRLDRNDNWIHQKMDFSCWAGGDWMQSERPADRWPDRGRSRVRRIGRRGYSPLVPAWNRWYSYWLNKGAFFVRFEDLLLDTESTCEHVAEHLGIERTTDTFQVPQEHAGGPQTRGDGTNESYVDALKRKEYLSWWDEDALSKLKKTADEDLLEGFGYSLDVELPEQSDEEEIQEKEEADRESPADIYWIMRGGAGDLVMLSYAMKKVLNGGYTIDLYTASPHSSWVSSLMDGWDGLTILDDRPEEGTFYPVVTCDCPSSTLRKRTDHMEYDRAINPDSFSGTPSDWGNDMADQIFDYFEEDIDGEGADRSDLYNVLADQLPSPRVPENVLIGTGVGNDSEEKAAKKWPISNWKQLCESCEQEFVFLGCETGSDHPPEWDRCPICESNLAKSSGEHPANQACEACDWSVRDMIGRTPEVKQVMEEMSRAALYVGVDNGLGHLAAAAGLPTMTVFGGTKADRYRPNTHNSLTFGDKGSPPDPEPVIEAVANMFARYTTPTISMIIATCNEGEELLRTVENARMKAGCPIEVVVVNDGGDDGSVERCPDWVKVDENPERTGVAPARQQGVGLASGPVLVFWDGHMRWTEDCGIKMARKAMEDDCVVMAPLKNLYGSDRMFGGAQFQLQEGDNRLGSEFVDIPDGGRYHKMTGFVAPCYAIPREIFEHIGGWPRGLQSWGQTEITLSLKLAMAGVDIIMDSDVTMWHMFRGSFSEAGYSGVSVKDVWRNNYKMCRICFEKDTFERFWLPLMRQARWFRSGCERWTDQDKEDREHMQEVKCVTDEQFFQEVLGMGIEQAIDKYLED